MSCHLKALFLTGLITLGEINGGDATFFVMKRFRSVVPLGAPTVRVTNLTNETEAPQGSATSASMVRAPFPGADEASRDGPIFEVLNKTEITKGNTSNCLCELGFFWHWRIHECVQQGGWGYECGFFPAEHHHRVCQDNLMCQKLAGAKDVYVSSGIHEGTAKTFPASCVPCNSSAFDCHTGEARHSEECIQEFGLTGEACQTLRVTVPSSATVSATKSHTATATASADAEGSAAEATEEKTATATHEATASANGVIENSACVSIMEAKKELDVEDVEHVGEVLGSRIIDAGEKMAFERAYDGAIEKAKKYGLVQATAAARAIAEAKAAQEAKLMAERMAHEASAWKAEAGANKQAQEAAASRAESLTTKAKQAAQDETVHRKAQADAEAQAKAEEAAAQEARDNIRDVSSGQSTRSQDDTIPRGAYPTNQTNPLRKISDKDLAGMNP